MATGNVTFDLFPGTRRLTPFVVGGLGMLFSRDQVRNGPFWSSDPAFTAGGGMRISIRRTGVTRRRVSPGLGDASSADSYRRTRVVTLLWKAPV